MKQELINQNVEANKNVQSINAAAFSKQAKITWKGDLYNINKKAMYERCRTLEKKQFKFLQEGLPKSRTHLQQRLDRAEVLLREAKSIQSELNLN